MMMVENMETETTTFTGAEKSFPKSALLNCEMDSSLSKFREPLESGNLSDVLIRVGKDTIAAHKLILSTNSEVFQAMLESDMKESQDNTVNLVDMDLTVAKAMLLWMYTRKVDQLSTEMSLQLYIAADRYMLSELKEKCREFVSKNLSSKNVGEVFEISKLHSDTTLEKAVKKFFAGDVKNVLKSEEWKEFSVQKPILSVELLTHAITSNEFVF
ncbi:TD and POZ domain-containing protein 3-like [Uloborus diversus]|uniref:TD and POZ domain-containing protein 3-like n=1 Tax=Uloborus diversus TaxID=327109 RepID=UPI00240A108A|nr:TD and POZ domain-containing protein 3-like [Uloborus diversus]